MKKNQDSLETV